MTRDTPPRRRFTVDEVLRMVEVGILQEDEPLELLEGELVEMSPQGSLHRSLKAHVRMMLEHVFGDRVFVSDQDPLDVGGDSLPEPDLTLLRGAPMDYVDAHPTGSDALLVVEIAVSSQATDRWKAQLYARGGVPEYWLIDVPARAVTVYRRPEDGEYQEVTLRQPGDTLPLPTLDLRWPVESLLP